MIYDEHLLKICSLLIEAAEKRILRKAVFSKPCDKDLLKSVMTLKLIGNRPALQSELFHKDNKATHKNFYLSELTAASVANFALGYMQINLLCNGGECEYRRSASGKSVLLNEKKLERLLEHAPQGNDIIETNDRQKQRILSGSEPFLRKLGVSDANGRVYDKKQAKFRQINRFLEIIRDCEDRLPHDAIRICDLCCGKSYLSFAAYHYFANVRGMQVSMTGVDLKPDVIEYCNTTARELGFDGLEFIRMDVNDYEPEVLPSIVISLHACDVATDVVLHKASEWKAEVILSTPCCHHELNHGIDCKELSFITQHSMLRQKLCDAATDALRLARLEAEGYSTSAVELIDPNETPKNVMLRAFRKKNFNPDSDEAAAARQRYKDAKRFLCGDKDTSVFHF